MLTTNHLLGSLERRVDGRCEWVDEIRAVDAIVSMVRWVARELEVRLCEGKPERRTAELAETTLRRCAFFVLLPVTNSPCSHAPVTIYVLVTVLLYSFYPLTRSLSIAYLGLSRTLRYLPFRVCLDPIIVQLM